MKKAIFITILTIGMAMAASGQDYKTSLGLRAGIPYGITVKHFVSKANAFEGILASSYGGFVLTGLYENVHWTGKYPGLNWYFGFGAHAGLWDNSPYYNNTDVGIVIGADFVVGLEYTFDEVPLNLSLDILPSFNLIGHTGWNGINGGLSIRYVF